MEYSKKQLYFGQEIEGMSVVGEGHLLLMTLGWIIGFLINQTVKILDFVYEDLKLLNCLNNLIHQVAKIIPNLIKLPFDSKHLFRHAPVINGIVFM